MQHDAADVMEASRYTRRVSQVGHLCLCCVSPQTACFNTLSTDADQSQEERTSSIKSGNGEQDCGLGATACIRNMDRRGSVSATKGIFKKFAARPINAEMELDNSGKLAFEATSELGSALVDGAGSSPSSISVRKELSPQEAAIDSVSSSAIKGCSHGRPRN
ncbi:UNVERIFIED_CONTAM: hypothetical protein FKN15_070675 [Acipenser sinensis]